jgi:hypothetical protein
MDKDKDLLLKYLVLKLLELLKLSKFYLLFEQLGIIGRLGDVWGRGGSRGRSCSRVLLVDDGVLDALHMEEVVEQTYS